jgi:membrane-associated phospholipid phosphatase
VDRMDEAAPPSGCCLDSEDDACLPGPRERIAATAEAVRQAARRANAAVASPPERRSVHAFRQRPLVYGAMAGYAVLSLGLMASKQVGITSEHVILLGLVAFAIFGRARPFVWDWLPFLFVAVMFEDLTSVGAKIAGSIHDVGPAVFERTFFGGTIAATWLQERIGTGLFAHVLDVGLASEYLFHFAAPLVAGLWLWSRHRDRFGTFVSAYMLVMSLGFITYLVYPEMPPWLAAQRGVGGLAPVHRIVVETLQPLGGFGNFYAGADPEPNAAMPSLHVAVPMLIACAVVSVKGWRVRRNWLWMLYPATIGFGVIYLGEHYISDTVVGVLLGAACFGVAEWSRVFGEARQARRTALQPVRLPAGGPGA